MDENQRQIDKAKMCDRRKSNQMSAVNEAHQLIDSSEIKQEPGIKEEPQPVGELEEIPALDNRADGQSFVSSIQLGCEDGFVNWSMNEAKFEVKEENGENIGKSLKSNDDRANEGVMADRQARQSSGGGTPNRQLSRKNEVERKAMRSTKMNVQRGGTTQHQCQQCDYKTKKKSHLERHFLKHTDETPFSCHRCGKAFKSKQNLQRHMKVHVEEFLFRCATCLEGFDQKNKKMEHESNCKTLRYECHLCKNSYGPMKIHLRSHMCVHSGLKPFECKECSKKFPQKSTLKRHMQLHAGPRSFRCSICRSRFAQEDEMIAHQEKCNRRVYKCYACGKSIGSHKAHLVRHMRTHTGDKPFQCIQCSKKYTQKSTLNGHMRMHSRSLPWKCAICRQGFVKQTQWKVHQRNCRRRIYECFDCKKFFHPSCAQLKRHMMKHSSVKAFQCEECGNRFTQKSNLTVHIKSIHMKKE